MARLDGKTALVTGASRGVGALVAKALAAEGASLVLHARTPERCEAVRDAIRANGGKAEILAAELERPDQVEALGQALLAKGGVDILYNNA